MARSLTNRGCEMSALIITRRGTSRNIVIEHVWFLIRHFHVLFGGGVVFRRDPVFRNDVRSGRSWRLVNGSIGPRAAIARGNRYAILAGHETEGALDFVNSVGNRRSFSRGAVA